MKIGETIYYCKKLEGEEEYDAPRPIRLKFNYFTLMPNRSFADIQIYGKDIVNYYTAYARLSAFGKDLFNKGGKFYLDYLKPDLNEENGYNANAEIVGISFDNHFIKLSIHKLRINNE